MAERLERIAHRTFTRQVRQHDIEPDLWNRLWADREIRAFWLSHARDLLDDIREEEAASLRARPSDETPIALGTGDRPSR